jgi:hypothetical protein
MRLHPVRSLFALLLLAGLSSAADPQLMGLLMPDSKVVAGINVENATNSPFGQFLLSKMPAAGEDFAKFTATTGFDPRHDLAEVLMATQGQPGEKGLILARGNFDSSRIFAAARQVGGAVESYNGVDILTGKDDSATHAVAFLGQSIAIAGDLDSVKAAIDRRASASSIDPALAAKVDQLSRSLDAWSVSMVPVAALTGEKMPDNKLNVLLNTDVLKAIVQSSGGIKFGAMIQVSAEAVARTDKDATALADVVRFLASLVQANAPAAEAAAITSLVQTLSVTTDGNTVKVGLTVPEEQLENALRSADHGKASKNPDTKL